MDESVTGRLARKILVSKYRDSGASIRLLRIAEERGVCGFQDHHKTAEWAVGYLVRIGWRLDDIDNVSVHDLCVLMDQLPIAESGEAAASLTVNDDAALTGPAATNDAAMPTEQDGDDAYVLISQIGWSDRFNTSKICKKFLSDTPTIRTKRLGPRRFGVHAADWQRYWADQDAKAFAALGVSPETIESALAGIEHRKREVRGK